MWFALTQIASLYAIGFRSFEIWQGRTGPVGTTLDRRNWVGIQ